MQGCVVAPVVELALAACFSEEVGHGEGLVGRYLTDDIGVLLEVDAFLGVIPMVGQIAVEAVCLAWCAEDDTRFLVAREDAIDDLTIVSGKGAILRVVDIVVEPANGGSVPPVVEAMLNGVVVGKDD